jgi:hypothetical protein
MVRKQMKYVGTIGWKFWKTHYVLYEPKYAHVSPFSLMHVQLDILTRAIRSRIGNEIRNERV